MKINKVLVVFVIIFFLTTVAGASYIVYEEFLNNNSSVDNVKNNGNTSSNAEETNGEEELDVNSRLVQSLYNKVVLNGDNENKYFMYDDNDNYIVSEASEESKLTLAYNNLKENEFGHVNTSNLPLTMVIPGYTYSSYILPYHTLDNGDVVGLGEDYVSFFSYDSLLLAYKDLFGNDKTVDKSISIKTDFYNIKYYVYNDSLDGYIPYVNEGGGTGKPVYSGNVSRAVKNDNQIVIYEEVSELSIDGESLSTYAYTFNIDDDGMYSFVSRIKE